MTFRELYQRAGFGPEDFVEDDDIELNPPLKILCKFALRHNWTLFVKLCIRFNQIGYITERNRPMLESYLYLKYDRGTTFLPDVPPCIMQQIRSP